jgi:hypothetical protein
MEEYQSLKQDADTSHNVPNLERNVQTLPKYYVVERNHNCFSDIETAILF